ncbi:MAG TPA: Gfo/Idh/MocA family oxidoreductase [Terriglobales bacterium]|nr:Gfo/Idh/MocA family oxidoreductase [Terriglobales bacterium]
MTDRRFRVALVGCGRIANVHAGYLRQTPHVDFIGASDLDVRSRDSFAGRWQVPTYADIDELLAAAQPEVVHLVTPPATHAPLAIQLMERGVDVLVEKPMALDVAEAERMVEVAKATGRMLTVDHNRWFDPVIRAAVRDIESGAIGKLAGIEVFQGAMAGEAQGEGSPQLQWSAALPGGSLFDSAPHPAYLLRGFLGKIASLDVIADTPEGGGIRELRAIARGANCLGVLSISQQARPFTNRVTVWGSEMSIEINLNNMTLIRRRTRKVPKLVGKVLPNLDEAFQSVTATVTNTVEFVTGRQRYYPGMGVHFRTLYHNLAQGLPAPVSAEEGRDVMWVVEEMWRQSGITTAKEAAA